MTAWVKSKRASSDTDDDAWRDQPVSPTLNAFDNGGDSRATVLTVHEQLMPFTQTQFAQYGEGVGTLRANGGDLGGGSETIVVSETPEIAACLRSGGDGGVPSSRGENLVVQSGHEPIGFSHTQGLDPQASTQHFPTLRAEGGGHAIMYER